MLYWLYWAFSTAITPQQSGRHTPVAVAPHSHRQHDNEKSYKECGFWLEGGKLITART
jgi:hypothetical protein